MTLLHAQNTASDAAAAPDSYYERHIFFCLNQRSNGEVVLRRPGRAAGV